MSEYERLNKTERAWSNTPTPFVYPERMRLILALSLLLGLSTPALEEEAPSCATIKAEARYQGLGYTHLAIVKNECGSALACELYSHVDPEIRHRVTVPAGETHEEALRRGSPASAFKLGYRCVARGELAR